MSNPEAITFQLGVTIDTDNVTVFRRSLQGTSLEDVTKQGGSVVCVGPMLWEVTAQSNAVFLAMEGAIQPGMQMSTTRIETYDGVCLLNSAGSSPSTPSIQALNPSPQSAAGGGGVQQPRPRALTAPHDQMSPQTQHHVPNPNPSLALSSFVPVVVNAPSQSSQSAHDAAPRLGVPTAQAPGRAERTRRESVTNEAYYSGLAALVDVFVGRDAAMTQARAKAQPFDGSRATTRTNDSTLSASGGDPSPSGPPSALNSFGGESTDPDSDGSDPHATSSSQQQDSGWQSLEDSWSSPPLGATPHHNHVPPLTTGPPLAYPPRCTPAKPRGKTQGSPEKRTPFKCPAGALALSVGGRQQPAFGWRAPTATDLSSSASAAPSSSSPR